MAPHPAPGGLRLPCLALSYLVQRQLFRGAAAGQPAAIVLQQASCLINPAGCQSACLAWEWCVCRRLVSQLGWGLADRPSAAAEVFIGFRV